jgi:L-methionine (R)-S-oxide reductase
MTTHKEKAAFYRELCAQLRALLGDERDPIANAANTSALLFQAMPSLNWAGFYFSRERDLLVLGPFQGRPACVRIPIGRGVCGTAAQQGRSVVVDDVHAFPGHIACDEASRSELVVPLVDPRGVIGVLDLDSPIAARFDEVDRIGAEQIASIYLEASDLTTAYATAVDARVVT